jgi:hypothetical protein
LSGWAEGWGLVWMGSEVGLSGWAQRGSCLDGLRGGLVWVGSEGGLYGWAQRWACLGGLVCECTNSYLKIFISSHNRKFNFQLNQTHNRISRWPLPSPLKREAATLPTIHNAILTSPRGQWHVSHNAREHVSHMQLDCLDIIQ